MCMTIFCLGALVAVKSVFSVCKSVGQASTRMTFVIVCWCNVLVNSLIYFQRNLIQGFTKLKCVNPVKSSLYYKILVSFHHFKLSLPLSAHLQFHFNILILSCPLMNSEVKTSFVTSSVRCWLHLNAHMYKRFKH